MYICIYYMCIYVSMYICGYLYNLVFFYSSVLHQNNYTSSAQYENSDVVLSIILGCRKLDSAHEAIRVLANDLPPDGSVKLVCIHLEVSDSK